MNNLIEQYERALRREQEAREWIQDTREAARLDPSCELLIDYTRLDVGMKTGTHRIPEHLANTMVQELKPSLDSLMTAALVRLARETLEARFQLEHYVQNLPRP